MLLEAAAQRAKAATDRRLIEHAIRTLNDSDTPEEAKHDAALGPELAAAIDRYPDRTESAELDEPFALDVDRELARFGSWYELFPRSMRAASRARPRRSRRSRRSASTSSTSPRSTRSARPTARARNNTPDRRARATPAARGRSARRTWRPRRRPPRPRARSRTSHALVARRRPRARDRGRARLRAPVRRPTTRGSTEHPEWFTAAPTARSQYAENPPKKYQDIYNVNFECDDCEALVERAAATSCALWIDRGVTVFRVDNPHTKPLRVLGVADRARSARTHPDVVFLAEAFTRPRDDAHAGQGRVQPVATPTSRGSTSRWELERTSASCACRSARTTCAPTSSPTPPTSSPSTCSTAGAPRVQDPRLVLAATLRRPAGVYSGYELFEHDARSGRAARSTSTPRSTRSRSGRSAALRCSSSSACSTRRAARTPRCSISPTSHSSTPRTTGSSPTSSSASDDDDPGGRVPRLAVGTGRAGAGARRPSGCPRPSQVQDLLDGSRYGLASAATSSRSRPAIGKRTSSAWWPLHDLRPDAAEESIIKRPDVEGPRTLAESPQDETPTRSEQAEGSPAGARRRRAAGQAREPQRRRPRRTGSRRDPLWFKTRRLLRDPPARVLRRQRRRLRRRRGLTEKLDYLQWLGVDCIWLLPFFASPLRDGGYDIADFYAVHPDYGTDRGRRALHRGRPRARHARSSPTS